jgi:hypothetical protein
MGKIERRIEGLKRKPAANSTYKELAVQRLNEALCFVSSSVLADSFRIRNRQLLELQTVSGNPMVCFASANPKLIIIVN